MRKYYSFFKVRFFSEIQYRMATVTALTTQFVWGLMECLAYKALLESDAIAFPMEYSAVVSYIWLKEAFLVLFSTWASDNDIFSMILDGGIAYELCRPVSIYAMWFSRTVGGRVAQAAMRCGPVLLCALLLPKPYKPGTPVSAPAFLLFVLAMVLALGVTVAFCMLVYVLSFFTISPQGWRMLLTGAVELLSGSIIPLPFIPQPFRAVMELLPFGSMQNVPFRIYSGDIMGNRVFAAVGLQLFWFVALAAAGWFACRKAERRIVVQGG